METLNKVRYTMVTMQKMLNLINHQGNANKTTMRYYYYTLVPVTKIKDQHYQGCRCQKKYPNTF